MSKKDRAKLAKILAGKSELEINWLLHLYYEAEQAVALAQKRNPQYRLDLVEQALPPHLPWLN